MKDAFKLLKWYPSLPKDWKVGMIIGKGDISWGYAPCSSLYTQQRIPNEWVENQKEYWSSYLFTTENGVDVYQGDVYYLVEVLSNTIWRIQPYSFVYANFNAPHRLYFSTKEAAQEYVNSKSIPEYIRIKNNGCRVPGMSSSFKKLVNGKVYKVRGVGKNEVYDASLELIEEDGFIQIAADTWKDLYAIYVTKVTKEEYEKQNKPKDEVGEWLAFDNRSYYGIFRFERFWDKNTVVSGEQYYIDKESQDINMRSGGHYCIDWNVRKATKEEIEQILIKVAQYKGFKEGVKYTNACDDNHIAICPSNNFKYNKFVGYEGLYTISTEQLASGWIYCNGKWGTIVEEDNTMSSINVSVPGYVVDTRQNGDNQVIIEYKTN